MAFARVVSSPRCRGNVASSLVTSRCRPSFVVRRNVRPPSMSSRLPKVLSNPTPSLQATINDEIHEGSGDDDQEKKNLPQRTAKQQELELELLLKDREYLWKEKEQLWSQQEQLRFEKEAFRSEKEQFRLEIVVTRNQKGQLWDPQQDTSPEICASLLQPLGGLPSIADLQDILSTPRLSAKLPLDPPLLQAVGMNSPWLATHFTTFSEQPSSRFRSFVEAAISANLAFYGEQLVAQAVDRLVTDVLLFLDKQVPPTKRLGLRHFRDAGDAGSLVTVLSKRGLPLRPDLQLRANDGVRLIYKGEEKTGGVDLSEAVTDLRKKTQAWTPLYYGDLPYFICHAAAGPYFQFYAIPKTSLVPEAVSIVFDMSTMDGRLSLILAAIQLYRLLAEVTAALPANVLPVDKLLEHSPDGLGFKRTLFYKSDELTVVKCVVPFSKYASIAGVHFTHLQQMYVATKTAIGLVHAHAGPVLDNATDTYKVELTPLGRNQSDAEPKDGEQLRTAVHGLLKGLDALHQAGFCHRDVRWPNVACNYDRSKYYLLDLEMVAPLDTESIALSKLTSWPEDVLVGDKYTATSDLYCLGCLFMERCFSTFDISDDGHDLLDCLKLPAQQQHHSAMELLAHRWFAQ